MKEVMAIVRMNMINKTKKALSAAGFDSMTCRKVYGRGKKKVDYELINSLLSGGEIESPEVAEAVSEGHRLVPKRLLTLIVNDDESEKVIDTIISVNKSGNAGDGKIFVIPVSNAVRVRTSEMGEEAI
ncbi:P-II family nitrogen regulator [Orenia marismortui]|uniref:Nitrogen regulatory protein P-II family n=1 Tax=Orenia marismortui TaxID=46469 RepID=A0A4R8HA52_9FIRM|nr:P-II family nitrogen regulator [Orenia marismortui]TDX52699.1 nitrogen regulatory protein P-II family [Orenia marismortui]